MTRMQNFILATLLPASLVSSHAHADQDHRGQTTSRRWPELGIGVKGGVGLTTFGGRNADAPTVVVEPRFGHIAGIAIALAFHERVALQLELLDMPKGADALTPDRMYGSTLFIDYVGAAALVDVNLWQPGDRRLYLLAGMEIGRRLESKLVSWNGYTTTLTNSIAKHDLGVIGGLGLAWRPTARHELMLESRLDIGIRTADVTAGQDNELLNRSLMFVLGYRYWVVSGMRKPARDRCPGEAEDLDGFQDGDGCPEPDNDGDGILDQDDACPGTDTDAGASTAEDLDGFEDQDGCPDDGDDQDRDAVPEESVPDVLEQCLNLSPVQPGPEP